MHLDNSHGLTGMGGEIPSPRQAAPGTGSPPDDSSAHRPRPDSTATALQAQCLQVTDTLRETMGAEGTTALLTRALARTQARHPSLKTIRRQDGREIHLDGVAAAVEKHGLPAVEAAVRALMTSLADVLGRLIGEDMAAQLMNFPVNPPDTGESR